MEQGDVKLFFLYDQNGLFGFDKISGTTKNTYYYRIDARGEIVALVNGYGNVVANYNYDPWGKILSVKTPGGTTTTNTENVALLNPFRYKSYVYDNETELYYLNSRYYDPEVCRFVSRDNAFSGIGGDVRGYNLFTYCMNNPVNMSDPDGNWPQWVNNVANWINTNIVQPVSDFINNIEQETRRNLPVSGEPNSSDTLYNPDGTPKQKRWYGPDGKAERDRDFNHQGNEPFPHDHVWNNEKRGTEHLPPSPAYEFSYSSIKGSIIVGACTIGILVVVADDVTGFGLANDAFILPLAKGIGEGLIMIFP